MIQQLRKYKRYAYGLVAIMSVVLALAGTYAPSAYACALPDGSNNGYLQADGHTCCPQGTQNNNNSCLFAKYINPVIALLSALVGIAVVIGIIYGAVEYTTSNGDPARAASGRKHIINALLGLAAFIVLYAFLQFIVPGGLANG